MKFIHIVLCNSISVIFINVQSFYCVTIPQFGYSFQYSWVFVFFFFPILRLFLLLNKYVNFCSVNIQNQSGIAQSTLMDSREKIIFDTCLNSKTDFVQVYCGRFRDNCNGEQGREVGLNCEYKRKWEFTAKEQEGGIYGWKLLTKRNFRDKRGFCSGQTNLTGFLLRAGQGDQTLPGGMVGKRNLFRYPGWSDSECEGFWLT